MSILMFTLRDFGKLLSRELYEGRESLIYLWVEAELFHEGI